MAYRILLADDSLTIQKVVELSFADSEYELMAVGSGDKAVAALDGFAPDLVLADVVMPGLSGYEVCEAVKSRPGGGTKPVVLLTGTFEPFDRARAERAGCDSIVTKPFDSHALVSLVADLIRKAEKAREEAAAAPAPAPEPAAPAEEPFEIEMEAGEAPSEIPPLEVPPAAETLETAETAEMPALEAIAPEPAAPAPATQLFDGEPGYATVALPIPTPEYLEAMSRAAAAGTTPGEGVPWPPPPPPVEEPLIAAAPTAEPLPEPVPEPVPEPAAPAEPLYELILPEEPVEAPPEAEVAPVLLEPPPHPAAEAPMSFESFLEPPAAPPPAAASAPVAEVQPAEPEAVPFLLEEPPSEAAPFVPEMPAPEASPAPAFAEPEFEEQTFEEPAPTLEVPPEAGAEPILEVLSPFEGEETAPLLVPAPVPTEVAVEAVQETPLEEPVAAARAEPEEDVFGTEPPLPVEEEVPLSSGEIPPPPPPFDAAGFESEGVEVETRDIERDMEAFEKSGSWASRPEVWEQAEAMGVQGPPDFMGQPEVRPAPEPPAPEVATAPFEVPAEVPEPPVELEALAAEASLTDLSKLIPAKPAPAAADVPTLPLVAGAELTDGDVERIARRVVQLMGEKVVREVAWDVVPELAERLIRERLRDIES